MSHNQKMLAEGAWNEMNQCGVSEFTVKEKSLCPIRQLKSVAAIPK
jgi:hypothetical protein